MALYFDGRGFDLSLNAAAPLQPWAMPLQQRARYAEFGRGPDAFDCLGLVTHVQSIIGRPVPSYADLYRGLDIEDHESIDALIRAEAATWKEGAGAPGDVLVLGLAKRAHHVAVLCGAGRALHVSPRKAVTIEPIEGRRSVTRFAAMRIYGVVAPAA